MLDKNKSIIGVACGGYSSEKEISMKSGLNVFNTLKNSGCEKIFQEKVSGTSTQGRDKLRECLDFVREGDEVVFTRVDRVARSVLDLQLIVKELTDKKVTITINACIYTT